MVVEQVGYLKLNQVQDLKNNSELFSIYNTSKNTTILILNTDRDNLHLTYPKQDRLPWKTVEGKKIVRCKRIYCSNETTEIPTIGWNNDEQIMTYKEFNI